MSVTVNSDENLRVGFVGAGLMAREHIRAFSAVPGVTCVGVHSRTETRAQALALDFPGLRVCRSLAELNEVTRPHVLVVAVTETESCRVTLDCMNYPCTLLLEKPPGLNLGEAEQLHAAAKSREYKVFVALNRRHLSSTQAALTGLTGSPDPRFIDIRDQEDLIKAAQCGRPAVLMKNWMYANSIHMVDFALIFGRGEVTQVDVVEPWRAHNPGLVISKILFSSGDVALYQCVWNRPSPWAVSVTVPDRRWELRPVEQVTRQDAGSRIATPVPIHAWDSQFKPGFRRQAEAVATAARGGAVTAPTLANALATMRLIHQIYSS